MKTAFIFIIISSLFFASCSKESISEKKFYETAIVMTGSLSSSDRVIATVEGKMSTDLAFKTSGRITSVLVKPGDKVKKDQILATLWNEEGSITSAGLSAVMSDISGALWSIDSLYDSRIENLDNDVKKAQIGIELAEKDLELAKQTYENSVAIFSGSFLSDKEKVAQSEKNLDITRNNFTTTKKLLEVQRESLYKNALNSMSHAFVVTRNARDFIDETFGVTQENRTKNDIFDDYLGAKDTTTKAWVEKAFVDFNTEYETMYAWYYANIVWKSQVDKEVLKVGLSRSLMILEHLRDTLHLVSGALEKSITSSIFPETDLDILKKKTSTFLSGIELVVLDSNGNGIKGSIASIDSFDANYALKIQQLEDAIDLAVKDLNLTKTGKDISSGDIKKNLETLTMGIKIKEDALRLAKIAISEVEKNREILNFERKSKFREIDSKLSEARMNKNLANNSIESGILRAPFDGIILTRNFDKGTMVSPSIPVFSLTSLDWFFVKAGVNMEETPIILGQKISFSRLSDDVIFEAKVSVLRTEPDIIHNKSYVELEFTGTGLIIWERGEILFEKNKHGVMIPRSAIITKYGENGVYVLENWQAHYTIISVLESNNDMSVISGLTIGQKIITKGKENILDGEILK